MDSKLYDVIVVGGGPGGLEAALQLGRYRWKTLVVDRGKGRASFVPRYLNLLGFPDGVSGQALLTMGRGQAEMYGVEFQDKAASAVTRDSDGLFTVSVQAKADLKAGNNLHIEQFRCRKLIFATGIMNRHPEVPNVFKWAGHAMYYCPDCDGHEVSGKKVVVLGNGNSGPDLAFALLNWTRRLQVVNVSPENQVSPDRLSKLSKFSIPIYNARLKEFIGEAKETIDSVILEDGTELACEKVFSSLGMIGVYSELAKSLGVETLPNGHIVVDPRTKETKVQGCWAVGDVVAAHSQQVSIAIADGLQAAIWVNKRLKEEGYLPN